MVSDLKSIYHEKYEEFDNDNLNLTQESEQISLDLPKGWSFICLNETINYYTEHLDKE